MSVIALPTLIKAITPEQVELLSNGLVAGVDEVGRGPLVGDVVTAAVILDPSKPIEGLNDSKKLSEKRRYALYQLILDNALSVSVGRANPQEIDQLNILHATMLAMQRAVAGLDIQPERVLVDGNRVPEFGVVSHAIIKGDGLVAAISAASIIAKVTRDNEMALLDAKYPQYGFAKHKGYPTKAHFEALELHGVLAEHRKSFKPVAERLSRS
ncbi:ribonuclease HII [Shewanella aestuarii]|uniref:Ribonuclease HII n=1 Tax=Shewanella aestuarii TaxID=1028752 RepID=A0A6G9QKM5_9GAMM|nr:ribonuclease HII [Shewanella aestuarii]QIR14938.1 ribonuclease HII [Shewanella aestuarii]